jgi:hypothetical protein
MEIVYETGVFIDREAVMKYAYLVNDLNAICFIDSVAQHFGHPKAVVPNMLLASYISTALTDHYGEGTIQFSFDILYQKQIPVESGIKIKLHDENKISETHVDLNFSVYEEIIKRKGGVNHSELVLAAEGEVVIIPGIRNYEKTN